MPLRLPMWLRHLFAIAILPFTVTVLVPAWIARERHIVPSLAGDAAGWLLQAAGLCVVAVGLLLFVTSQRRFANDGRGTLAPWDPPRRLVVNGPYRYVRNPMISGVVCVLWGEAMALRSWPHAAWAAAFVAINAVVIITYEEPQLRRRFGAAYDEYCGRVPRLLPTLRPWMGEPPP